MKNKLSLFLRIIVALILAQTLFFKFTAAPESIYIFEKLGQGDVGRIGSGIIELIAVILILYPKTKIIGTIISLVTISGALFFHLTKLGIEVMDDKGMLFYMALIVFLFCILILWIHRKEFSFKKNK